MNCCFPQQKRKIKTWFQVKIKYHMNNSSGGKLSFHGQVAPLNLIPNCYRCTKRSSIYTDEISNSTLHSSLLILHIAMLHHIIALYYIYWTKGSWLTSQSIQKYRRGYWLKQETVHVKDRKSKTKLKSFVTEKCWKQKIGKNKHWFF